MGLKLKRIKPIDARRHLLSDIALTRIPSQADCVPREDQPPQLAQLYSEDRHFEAHRDDLLQDGVAGPHQQLEAVLQNPDVFVPHAEYFSATDWSDRALERPRDHPPRRAPHSPAHPQRPAQVQHDWPAVQLQEAAEEPELLRTRQLLGARIDK